MSLAKYDKYKDSGVEWLGDIPDNWKVMRIKDVIFKIGSGVTPKGGGEVYVDKGIPLVRSQNVYDDGLRLDNVSFITEEINNRMPNSQLKPNDILINITGASIGRSCIVPVTLKKANINQHIIYLRTKKNIVPYLSTYIKSSSIKGYIMLIQAGSSKEALNMGQTLNISILVPSFSEQTAIASYLDLQTSAIDRKIALLEQKISHYQQLRKSLINETVCRGLDRNVKLKDSGIEWIGMIPEHWEVKRVKELFETSRGRVIGQNELIDNGKYPVYSSQTENDGCLGYIETYDFNKTLITWTTDGANAGTVFKRSGKFNCTNICGTLTPIRKNIDIDFMAYAVQESTKHNKRIDTNGAKIMSNEMRIIQIIYPQLLEQTAIASYLDKETQKIDSIVSNIKSQIETLKELRKTLINDVVTGKIKVTA